jgi:F420-dependent oxidoreductase-like protein
MRIGIFTFPSTIDSYIDSCKAAAKEGFQTVWSPQVSGLDTMQLIGIAAREVPDIEFATAVVPTFPRHPLVMAQQALTTASASGGRFTLGIGLSHKVVIEGMYGMSFDKPARHMREYLSILLPTLRDKKVNFVGETLTGRGQLQFGDTPNVPVMLAALAPAMLKLAGTVADGTILWMTGPATTRDRVAPALQQAADAAERAVPRIVAGMPMCLTSDADAARARAAKEYAVYGQLPSYRAMLDAEGLAGPADLAIIGDEAALRAGVEKMQEAGVDEFVCAPFGSADQQAATRALLGSMTR